MGMYILLDKSDDKLNRTHLSDMFFLLETHSALNASKLFRYTAHGFSKYHALCIFSLGGKIRNN